MDSRVAAHPLHVVPRDESAHRVPDDVDALVARIGADLLGQGREPRGHLAYVIGKRAVVEPDHSAKPASAEPPLQQSEDRPVVGYPMDQHDRGACRLNIPDHEATLDGWKALEAVPARLLTGSLFDKTKRIQRDVRG